MSAPFTPEENTIFAQIPELDLIDLAAELDLIVPETIDRETLITQALSGILDRASQEGLPFSTYDREDLQALPSDHLKALANLCATEPTVDAMLKRGAKVYKTYRKQRPGSQVPMLLPMFLSALARFASLRGPS